MTLSVEMIAESMQPFGARVVMQQERTFAFRRVQMLTPESENTLEEDVLYVSEPKVIRRLPKGLLHDHFFVVRARPEDAEPVRPGVNALLYDEQYSLGAVTNHLLTLFDRLQTLEYQMRLAVRAACACRRRATSVSAMSSSTSRRPPRRQGTWCCSCARGATWPIMA